MVYFCDLGFMFFSVVLEVVHGVGQGMGGDVGICSWHSIVNNGCPFVVEVRSSDYDFS